MTPCFTLVARSLRAGLILGTLTLAAACAHGAEVVTPEDGGPGGGGSGGGGEAGSAGIAGDGERDSQGGSGGVAGSVDPEGDASGGSDITADGGEDAVNDVSGDVAADAVDAHEAGLDSSRVDAAGPKRPTGITMSATSVATLRQAPSTGGVSYNDECPPNQALVGFKGTVDALIDGGGAPTNLRSVQGVCAPLSVSATEPYRVNAGVTSLLPVRQTPSTVAQSLVCPANQVIVGFVGRTAMYIEEMQFRCAPLVISGTTPTFTLALGTIATTGPIGAATAGTAFTAIDCPAGQVAVAQAPRAGTALDSFGMVCRTPTLVIQ